MPLIKSDGVTQEIPVVSLKEIENGDDIVRSVYMLLETMYSEDKNTRNNLVYKILDSMVGFFGSDSFDEWINDNLHAIPCSDNCEAEIDWE